VTVRDETIFHISIQSAFETVLEMQSTPKNEPAFVHSWKRRQNHVLWH